MIYLCITYVDHIYDGVQPTSMISVSASDEKLIDAFIAADDYDAHEWCQDTYVYRIATPLSTHYDLDQLLLDDPNFAAIYHDHVAADERINSMNYEELAQRFFDRYAAQGYTTEKQLLAQCYAACDDYDPEGGDLYLGLYHSWELTYIMDTLESR